MSTTADSTTQRTIDVMVLGAGRMGQVHIRALREISAQYLEPTFGISLRLSVVERDPQKWAAIPDDVTVYADLTSALEQGPKPEIAMLAFNDDQHALALDTLFKMHPDIQAIFSEKPLTETLAEAIAIKDELKKRYLSMNTVINFSPVLNHKTNIDLPPDAKLIGFEATWGKDRTADTRPSIGVPSESVHAISLITDMFGQKNLRLREGSAVMGDLSVAAKNVIYDLKATFQDDQGGVPVRFETSYVLESQQRRVTAFYEAAGDVYAAEYSFDTKFEGRNADVYKLYRVDAATGAVETIRTSAPEQIAMGNGQTQLTNDRVTSYNLLSLIDYLGVADAATEELIAARLISLDAVLDIQAEIEQINAANPALKIVRQDADPAKLRKADYSSLSETSPAEVMQRVAALRGVEKPEARVQKPAAFTSR